MLNKLQRNPEENNEISIVNLLPTILPEDNHLHLQFVALITENGTGGLSVTQKDKKKKTHSHNSPLLIYTHTDRQTLLSLLNLI